MMNSGIEHNTRRGPKLKVAQHKARSQAKIYACQFLKIIIDPRRTDISRTSSIQRDIFAAFRSVDIPNSFVSYYYVWNALHEPSQKQEILSGLGQERLG